MHFLQFYGSCYSKVSHQNYVFGGDGGSRTHVQKYRHLSVYECSQHIRISLIYLPADRRPKS